MASVSSFTSGCKAFKANAGLSRRQPVTRGALAMTMRRKDIHPEWFSEAKLLAGKPEDVKVMCNGVEVMTVGGTKPVYSVDVYSGNHPFYQGAASTVVVDEGQLNKFKKRFADLEELSQIAVLTTIIGDDAPKKEKKEVKGGKKKRR